MGAVVREMDGVALGPHARFLEWELPGPMYAVLLSLLLHVSTAAADPEQHLPDHQPGPGQVSAGLQGPPHPPGVP